MAARKLNHLILVTILLNGFALALLAVALGTNNWFSGKAKEAIMGSIDAEYNYGLFKGHKTLTLTNDLNTRKTDLILTCNGNKCMFSCGLTSSLRKADLENIITNNDEDDTAYCTETETETTSLKLPRAGANSEIKFINFALLIVTIILIALALIFIVMSGVLALYNTYRAPIHPVLSVFGLYIWNTGAAVSIILAMIIWIAVHATTLAKNPVISQTLVREDGPEGYIISKSILGYSFWMLLPAFLLSVINLVILKFRAWKIVKMEEKHVKVMNTTLDNGDILLF